MPNYFYVRDDGGSNVGTRAASSDTTFTTLQTSWPASVGDYYPSIKDAADAAKTNPPTSGDYIIVANDHNHTYAAGNVAIVFSTASEADPVFVVGVNPSDPDGAPATGGVESTAGGGGYNYNVSGSVSMDSIKLLARNSVFFSSGGGGGTTVNTVNCTFGQGQEGNGGNPCLSHSAESSVFHRNVTIEGAGTSSRYLLTGGTNVKIFGGQVTGTWNSTNNNIMDDGGVDIYGFDFSSLSATNIYGLSGQTGASGTFNVQANLINCRFPSGGITPLQTNDWVHPNNGLTIVGSTGTSAEAEWTWGRYAANGEAEMSSSTYRNQSVSWPGGDKTSIVVDTATEARAGHLNPFGFPLPSRYAALSSTSTDLVTVYLSSNTSLTDQDVWGVLVYSDGTNKHIPNIIDKRNTDPFDQTGTALTTDTGSSWTSGGSNLYRLEFDTSGDPGADGVPTIWIFVAVQATIYIDSQVDLS